MTRTSEHGQQTMGEDTRNLPDRPRLTVVTSTWPRGPDDVVGRFLLELVRALPLRCEVVCPDDAGHGTPALPGVPLHRFRQGGLFYGAGALANLLEGRVGRLGTARDLLSMLVATLDAGRDSDVLFSHWAVPGGLVGSICRRLLCRPHVALLHSADVFWLERHPIGPALARFIADHCDALCGVSREVVERFAALSGRRGRVLGCGVLLGEWATHGERAPGTASVGSLSRFVPGKGLRRLVRLADGLPGRLLLAGDGPLRTDLAARCAATRRARLVGPLLGADKRRWLARLDVFAAPLTSTPWGQREGLPVAVLEAQAAGLPVVAFAGALPDGLVRDGRNGRLVPAGDWRAFAAALCELLDDSDARRALGAAARRDVQPHGLEQLAATWTQLFIDVASRGRGGGPVDPTGATVTATGC